MGRSKHSIGLDFGTTNSSVAWLPNDGALRLARFPFGGTETESYRSLVYFENRKAWTGPAGIEQYLAADPKGRLIQSLKSFLASRSLVKTDVFGRAYALEDLLAMILRDIKAAAEKQFGISLNSAVVGRPVRFAGSRNAGDDAVAVSRLRLALETAGYEDVSFELEPVAAAFHYESTLDHDELILIGDFGGGTSDFSLLQVGPSRSGLRRSARRILADDGVGLAGDAFDAKLVKHVVSPALGAGTSIESMGKTLPVPSWVYAKLERWHHLSLLKGKETLDMLRSVRAQALRPDLIDALLDVINLDLGYQIHQAIQRTKAALSSDERAPFLFEYGDCRISTAVTRKQFELWIREDLHAMEACVDRLLAKANTPAAEVDMVFLTGGSSFVPAVRRIFEARFGNRIRSGDEFTSVARGLALSARRRTRG